MILKKRIEMNILLISNSFNGAYGSIHVFLKELKECLEKEHDTVYVSTCISESLDILEHGNVDFSVGFGKYMQWIDGRPLYDIKKVMHYQWIIDNPMKMELDETSQWIKYIFIDEEFYQCTAKKEKIPYLNLPLGVRQLSPVCNKAQGIVFSGQIKNANKIYSEIKQSAYEKEIKSIIDHYLENLDGSFIKIISEDKQVEKEIFGLSNSFFRAYKRIKVIQAIKEYPVYLIGDVGDEELRNRKNVHLLGKQDYGSSFFIASKYKFALNVDPNYQKCVHDRVTRSICSGTMPVSNYSVPLAQAFGENILYYHYSEVNRLEDRLHCLDAARYDEMLEKARDIVSKKFTWNACIERIKSNYQEGKTYGNLYH